MSKAQPVSAVAAAFDAGQRDFGESYVQEALPKIHALADRDIAWHFIGQLQANKTRSVAESFAWVHTLDRDKLARRLHEQRPESAPPLQVLIQVDYSGAADRGGIGEAAVAELARAIQRMPRLRLRGLMTVPPQTGQPAHWFARLATLRDRLSQEGLALDTLSMGMSGDFEDAIAAGSNCVRIGTAIFGARETAG